MILSLFLGGAFVTSAKVNAQPVASDCLNYHEYQASEGETLSSISKYFGSPEFKKIIAEANPELFSESGELNSARRVKIPYKIFFFEELNVSLQETLANPFCTEENSVDRENIGQGNVTSHQEVDTSGRDELEEFRAAFEELINKEREAKQEKIQAKSEQELLLELDGLVTDETRSKIGRDFYDIFYQKWQAPPDSKNFTITISEKPTPSLGSLITVRVNDQQVFQYRLQPRYEIIEQVAEYAVQVTYRYMKENKHQYTIY